MEEYEARQNLPLLKNPVYSPDSKEWLISHGKQNRKFLSIGGVLWIR